MQSVVEEVIDKSGESIYQSSCCKELDERCLGGNPCDGGIYICFTALAESVFFD